MLGGAALGLALDKFTPRKNGGGGAGCRARVYNWVPRTSPNGPPFVEGETPRVRLGVRRYLVAGDGRRVSFPRRIMDSPTYYNSDGCRVALYVQTDGAPYPGVDYVMEIHLQGDRDVITRFAGPLFSALNPLRRPLAGQPSLTSPRVAGVSVAANVLAGAAAIAREGNLTRRVELSSGVGVVRYDFLPG